jgi:hypothetical protein
MSAPLTSLQAPPSGSLHQPARIPATVLAGESLPLPAREVAAAAEYARADKAEATLGLRVLQCWPCWVE